MRRTIAFLFLTLTVLAGSVSAEEPPDTIMGYWEGTFTQKDWRDKPVCAKLVTMRRNMYRTAIEIPLDDGSVKRIELFSKRDGDAAEFEDDVDLGPALGGECQLEGKVAKGELKGRFKGKGAPGKFEMKRVEKKSPTLGAKPPQGAVVLLDGTNLDEWKCSKEPWALVEGGAMEVRKGNIVSKQAFGDAKYHIEFRTPFMPTESGQGRGNSGVYVQGRYEIQVLDSFGLETKDNECGGIYKKAVPKVNACLPPCEWQTYDITFRAPRFTEDGAKKENARLTVEHNGIIIHENIELDSACAGGVAGDEVKSGPLMLQDHHNPVRYRNIWVQPLDL